ncbi:MAG: NPCBM/NEW2 domain-containing protein [Burkholderiales bacterium]|nr:NPCBM/NEW2 domain-containing protein [Phycisphaerae bacterium]
MNTSATRLFVIVTMLWLTHARSARAEEWTITTNDFESQSLTIKSIDAKSLTGRSTVGANIVLPAASLLQLHRAARIESPKGFVLCIAGGDRWPGRPVRIDGTDIVWSQQDVGEMRIPLERALGAVQAITPQEKLDSQRGEDELLLTNGDVVNGIVTGVNEKSVTITPAGAQAVEVPIDSIRELLFASPPQGRPKSKPPEFTVRFTNGGVLSADSIAWRDNSVIVQIAGANAGKSVELGQRSVAAIERSGGRVAWLSSRVPTGVSYTPFFQGNFAPRMDRTVTGGPIRFGKNIYQRGIGMHSRTRMTWTIEPGDASFRTRYAIDPQLSYADVDVRVYVDEKIIHETKGFKAAALSPVVTADLAGAKTITLEVDYGQNYDVQDRLDWIEPAIIRKAD